MVKFKILITLFLVWSCIQAEAQLAEPTDPVHTEEWSSEPVILEGIIHQANVPKDAIILLGNNLNLWTKPDGSASEWTIEKGIMTVKPGAGDIISKISFEDCQLHIEWRSPEVIKGNGQGRGNSGVFLQSRYEVQILDSYNNVTYYNGQAGSIYKQHKPLVNACSKTGEWNSYDIIYKAPDFDHFGNKISSARVTVIHNGVVIQNNVEILGTTEYIGFPKNAIHGGGPIRLQDHGDLVSYRNIWIRRL